MKTIWQDFLQVIREEKGSRIVETWFKAVTFRHWDMDSNTVWLEVPNQFVKDWLQSHYIPLIQEHLARLLHTQKLQVVLENIQEEIRRPMQQIEDTFVPATSIAAASSDMRKKHMVRTAMRKPSSVNGQYTFDTFVVGPSNSLAYAAAQAVSQKPGELYNPLFIYGGSGLGKTHLLHAIGNEVKLFNKNAMILYQTADRFVNEFINAIRFDKVHLFKEKYHAVDLLLIDDIQFISNKEQTQEAFFHIFNSLYDARKQLVFTSDMYPQDIRGIAERLSSRLVSGMITDIHAPSVEIKIAIIKKKALLHNITLDDEVAHFIASQGYGNVRELEGALIRVIAYACLVHEHPSLSLVQKVLIRQETVASGQKVISLDRIADVVARHFSYSSDILRSKERSQEIAFARHVAIYLMKKLTDKSLRIIGDFFGGRDHSTVKHAIQKITQHVCRTPQFHIELRALERTILE